MIQRHERSDHFLVRSNKLGGEAINQISDATCHSLVGFQLFQHMTTPSADSRSNDSLTYCSVIVRQTEDSAVVRHHACAEARQERASANRAAVKPAQV